MEEIKLKRNFGRKTTVIMILGIIILTTAIMVARDILFVNIGDGISFDELINILTLGVISFLTYVILSLLIISRSMIRLTNEGVWQFQFLRPIFIRWNDVQKVEARLGVRIIISHRGVIQVYLEDFKEPDKLVAEIEIRVPPSALIDSGLVDL
jgi:hypothetical protein